MKKTIIITHYDRNIDPRSATVKGNTEKEMIYNLLSYEKTEDWSITAIGEDHPYIKATFDDEIPFSEAEPLLNFNTLEEFKEFVETRTDYVINIQ